MTGVRTVAVIGLGLIGGSLARELAARGVRVLGFDRDPRHLRAAMAAGAVQRALDASLAGVAEAEVVVLAVPVSAAPKVLETTGPWLGGARLITDVGSTKRSIVAAAERLGLEDRFVGAHPLAGDHRSGWEAARTGLFANARVYLCPTPETAPAALQLVQELWTGVGAVPEQIDAAEHDRRLAWTSHLPQAASTALALALARAGLDPSDLGPGGRGVTRLAGSSPEMWTAVALDNAAALTEGIAALEAQLGRLRTALEGADAEALHRCFSEGREWAARDGDG